MKIQLTKFIEMGGHTIYLTDLCRDDEMYIVIPEEFHKMESYSEEEVDFLKEALQSAVRKMGYKWDKVAPSYSIEAGLAVRLERVYKPSKEVKETWH